ncbi:hypothetical protein [Azotosporobacter soli]|uniref:hypothetical protein n=1 Tax=Azotosporobacter soli TaxID=3055040 RepID=UPI0031FE79B7
MFKLGNGMNEKTIEHFYSNSYVVENTSDTNRLKVSLSKSHIATLIQLLEKMDGPFFLLYILHTPRTTAEAARYQSAERSKEDAVLLLQEFEEYLENDGRHDLWLHAPKSNTTLVYDRHNLLFLYGLNTLQTEYVQQICSPVEEINIPTPHKHFYHAKYDAAEEAILKHISWRKSPLTEQDMQ